MPGYATPGVYFESANTSSEQISAVRTDIAAFIGIAQMGPLHQPAAVNTWQQFRSIFGNFLPNGFLAYAAKAFFDNGGDKLYVVRVAAPAVAANSVGAQPADGSASMVDTVAGFAAGAVVQASQDLTAHSVGAQPVDRASSLVDTVAGFIEGTIVQVAQGTLQLWRKVTAADATTKQLSWDVPLDAALNLANPIAFRAHRQQDLLTAAVDPGTLKLTWASPIGAAFDLTQPVKFATGASASSGFLYGADGNPTLRIDAASPGIWGDQVQVSVSHSSLAATATSGVQPTSGAVSFVQSVVGFPAGSLVRLYQAGSPVGFRLVTSVDASTNLLEWDAALAPQFDVTKDISMETVEFSLLVLVSGSAKEIFDGLSLVPTHPRYVKNAVTSAWIAATDLAGPGAVAMRLPDPAAPQLNEGILTLSGGRDGIAALQPGDFTGDPGSSDKTGLRTLEDVEEVAIVAVPDIMIEPSAAVLHAPLPPPTPEPCCGPVAAASTAAPPLFAVEAAPIFSLDSIYRVQQAVVEHCEAMRFRFAILDSPNFGSPALRIDAGEVQSWRRRFDTEFAALYFPWIMVRDPLQLGNQVVRRVPPSGHVAGVYANSDLTVGVHNAPANTLVLWAQALTSDVSENLQAVMNPAGIDCLRVFPGRGLRVYGARTMSSDPAWRFLNVRRLVSMIEHALLISLQWSVFEPNTPVLWNTVRLSASNFLESIWRSGGLVGNTADQAFYVICDVTNNPPATQQQGELIIEIGVAPVIPAEFVIFRIGKSKDALEVTEL
jgi:phage tail sheath protein FI